MNKVCDFFLFGIIFMKILDLDFYEFDKYSLKILVTKSKSDLYRNISN